MFVYKNENLVRPFVLLTIMKIFTLVGKYRLCNETLKGCDVAQFSICPGTSKGP